MMEMGAEILRMLLRPELYCSVFSSFTHFSESAAAILLTAVWQGLAIALFLTLCLRLAPRVSARVRFVILAGGFAAIVALPFLPALTPGAAHGNVHTSAAISAVHPWLLIDTRWSAALTLLWLVASLWRAVDLGVHTQRLRKLWKNAQPVDSSVSTELPKLRGRRQIEICTTDDLEKPSVIGFLAPRILIPAWLLERMSQSELEQIVLHETEHLRRGDDWTNLLQKLSLVFFPLHPALLWMERRLCLEREMACDEGVVRRTRAPRAYAVCLTNLAEHGLERREQALSLGAWQRRPEVARRVHSLLAKKPVLKPAAAGGMIAILGCGILAGSAELARCPQLIGFATHRTATRRIDEAPRTVASVTMEGDRVLRPEMRSVPMSKSEGITPHATELRAVLPMRSEHVIQHRQLARSVVPQEMERDDFARLEFPAGAVPQQKLLKAEPEEMVGGYTQRTADEEQSQGWVVMTTMWEQVETAPAPVADDSGNQESQSADEVRHASVMRPRTRMTVTRLVLRMSEPNAAQTTEKAGTTNSTDNKTDPTKNTSASEDSQPAPPRMLPAIVPVRGGWLIFQL